jgi:hypothetical protein
MRRSKTLPAVMFGAAALIVTGSVRADDWFTRTFGGDAVKGSGDMVTESRVVKEFTWIEAHGAFDIFVKAGDTQQVLLTFDDNLLELIRTDVRGKTLKIYSDRSYRSRHTCQVEITVPRLEGVTIKGSGDMRVEGFDTDEFECRTDGSGDIEIVGLKNNELKCDISGSGDITVRDFTGDVFECRINGSGDFTASGTANELKIDVYGSGDVDARSLTAKEVEVTVMGSGDVKVFAQESFDGSVYGSGDIVCFGDPQHKSRHVAGSGSIRVK